MGTLAGLLLLPFTAPVSGFRFFLERIRDEADAVLYDEGRIFAELIDLSTRRNLGELSETEFAEQEAALIERVRWIRAQRAEMVDSDLDWDDDEMLDNDAYLDGEEW